ncbi:MAG TPA: glycosyltransferase [Nocardioidaceae bacterium]|nr:glycosyltransferase [Nocardioidaceae bacterium]
MSRLGSVKQWVRARVASPEDIREPKLSIVVPVYNVEGYLEECLDSILAQPYDDLEVVLVDDGSTDSSAEIARRYAEAHHSFRLVSQANAGLGAARNAGVEAARGQYLTFLDSDDRLPADAYSAMMRTLEQSGSDFAIGKLVRDEGDRRYAMPRMRDNHRVRRVGVTLGEMPRILADVFAVNKIYRRSFWDEARLAFPTDIRYEDQPTLTRAFLEADRFDVLTETVYLWRIRTDGSSITQRRDDIADLYDRILTKRSSTEAVLAKAPHLLRVWQSDILPVDMWEYFRAVPGCADEYWDLLRSAMEEFWSEETVPFHRTWIPVQQRLMGWLVTQDRREDLVRLIEFVDGCEGDLPLEQRGDRVVALLPGTEDGGLPEDTYVLGDHELRWEARVTRAAWAGGRLEVDGFALIRNVPTAGRDTELTARLVGPDDRAVDVPLKPVEQPRATKFAGRPSQNYDACGFRLTVDPAVLESPEGTWRLELERRVAELRRGGGVTSLDRPDVDRTWHDVGGATQARLHEVDDGLLLQIRRGS